MHLLRSPICCVSYSWFGCPHSECDTFPEYDWCGFLSILIIQCSYNVYMLEILCASWEWFFVLGCGEHTITCCSEWALHTGKHPSDVVDPDELIVDVRRYWNPLHLNNIQLQICEHWRVQFLCVVCQAHKKQVVATHYVCCSYECDMSSLWLAPWQLWSCVSSH